MLYYPIKCTLHHLYTTTKHILLYILLLLSLSINTYGQLKPGFDSKEYLELLRISRKQMDTVIKGDKVPQPMDHRMVYRSAVGPLQNRWDLWVDNNHTAVISIRGTTGSQVSWLENFYAAMVPAVGQLHINDTTNFAYHLANNPKATVHIGWLLGMADLSKTIIPKIRELAVQQGIKNFIIMGHSQGAAIVYLLRSHIDWLEKSGQLPTGLTYKTYCSAPPKPGNTYYGYDFDYLTRGGWAISVINAADWVPETPFSIQTINDFNSLNPFANINSALKSQSFFVKLYVKHIYNRLKKPAERAVKNNEKYLGHMVYKFIKKSLPQFKEPDYAPNNLFVHCGTPVILMPDDGYRKLFPDNPKNVFTHHMFWPYYYLAEKEYATK